MSTTRLLFARLLDDAAMFPPGNASAGDALAAHLGYRTDWFSDLVGPLLVHASRWDELVEAHTLAGSPAIRVVVIGRADPPGAIPTEVDVVGVEVAPEPQLPLPASPLPTAFEITRPELADAVVAAVVERRTRGRLDVAKFRTGGTEAAAFPDAVTVARIIDAAAHRRAPLKFTAGLHHAVRAVDPVTGVDHHGFLNLLVAVDRAVRGTEMGAIVAALGDRDGAGLAKVVDDWTTGEITAVRAIFTSFGCCGVTEPVDDLLRLGLLHKEDR